MSTEEDYYLLVDAERSLVYTGDTGDVYRLEVYAPAAELAHLAAILEAKHLRLELATPRLGRHDPLDPAVLLNYPLRLSVERPAWPALRELIARLWNIDLADYPVAFYRASKYSIDIVSPAQALLVKLWRRAKKNPALAAARGQKIGSAFRYTENNKKEFLCHILNFDYYGWPATTADGVEELMTAARPDFLKVQREQPELWAEHDRSNWLYTQGEKAFRRDTEKTPYVAGWMPGQRVFAPFDYRQHPGLGTYRIPDNDPGLAAWPEQEILWQPEDWQIPVEGDLAALLKIQQALRERRLTAERRWSKDPTRWDNYPTPVLSLAELRAETDLLTKLGRQEASALATAYLVDQEHQLVMAAALGLDSDRLGDGENLPRDWDFYLAVSGAQPLPVANGPAELLTLLNQRDWGFANKGLPLVVMPLAKTALCPDEEGEEYPGEVYVKYTMPAWKIRATVGVQSKQPVLLKLTATTWQARVFELEPDLAQRTLKIALTNAQGQTRSRLEAATPTRQIKTRQAKNFLDALSTREDVACQVWAEETGLSLRIQIPTRTGLAIFEAQNEVTVSAEESRIAAFEKAQERFVNKFGSDSSYNEDGLVKWLIDLAIAEVA
jgi:hypothetical protein